MQTIYKIIITAFLIHLAGCTGIPNGVDPVTDFNADRYLGKWYEIARLNHSFEEGLEKVTAEYEWQEDGGISVLNRGYLAGEDKWEEATGKAYFKSSTDLGHLKVSFFGPFYSSYVVFELDEDYQYAFVTGHNRKYLWLLSRTPTITEAVKRRFLERINTLKFDERELIWVDQR